MDERGQFTFYRSFWEAIKGLPKKDKLPILEAIISYALDGIEPSGLSQSQSAFFLLVKPTLDSSRKKAANGKQTKNGVPPNGYAVYFFISFFLNCAQKPNGKRAVNGEG